MNHPWFLCDPRSIQAVNKSRIRNSAWLSFFINYTLGQSQVKNTLSDLNWTFKTSKITTNNNWKHASFFADKKSKKSKVGPSLTWVSPKFHFKIHYSVKKYSVFIWNLSKQEVRALSFSESPKKKSHWSPRKFQTKTLGDPRPSKADQHEHDIHPRRPRWRPWHPHHSSTAPSRQGQWSSAVAKGQDAMARRVTTTPWPEGRSQLRRGQEGNNHAMARRVTTMPWPGG